MKYYCYIIYSPSHDIYYKGFTTNILNRLDQHNSGKSQYTANKAPWKLVFVQSFSNKNEALKREKSLKRQHRKYLNWLINQDINDVNQFI